MPTQACLVCALVTPSSPTATYCLYISPCTLLIPSFIQKVKQTQSISLNCMAFGKRTQRWLLLLVFLCLVGCMEAIKTAPRRALLFDSRLQDANRKGTSIPGFEVVESQTVLTKEAEMIEERRILLAKRYGLMENTFDYPPSGPNHSHDPKVPHPYGNEKTNN